MSRERELQRFSYVPGVALLPEEFWARLTRLKEASGLTWQGFASMIGVDYRQVLRWRKRGPNRRAGPCCPWWRWPNRCLAEWIFSWAGTWRSRPWGGSRAVGRQQWVYRLEPSRFPEDFPQRLVRFKEAAGFSWRGLARELRVDIRQLKRWRNGHPPRSGEPHRPVRSGRRDGPAAPAAAGGGKAWGVNLGEKLRRTDRKQRGQGRTE